MHFFLLYIDILISYFARKFCELFLMDVFFMGKKCGKYSLFGKLVKIVERNYVK